MDIAGSSIYVMNGDFDSDFEIIDLENSNTDLFRTVALAGYPALDLGNDTVFSGQGFTVTDSVSLDRDVSIINVSVDTQPYKIAKRTIPGGGRINASAFNAGNSCLSETALVISDGTNIPFGIAFNGVVNGTSVSVSPLAGKLLMNGPTHDYAKISSSKIEADILELNDNNDGLLTEDYVAECSELDIQEIIDNRLGRQHSSTLDISLENGSVPIPVDSFVITHDCVFRSIPVDKDILVKTYFTIENDSSNLDDIPLRVKVILFSSTGLVASEEVIFHQEMEIPSTEITFSTNHVFEKNVRAKTTDQCIVQIGSSIRSPWLVGQQIVQVISIN